MKPVSVDVLDAALGQRFLALGLRLKQDGDNFSLYDHEALVAIFSGAPTRVAQVREEATAYLLEMGRLRWSVVRG